MINDTKLYRDDKSFFLKRCAYDCSAIGKAVQSVPRSSRIQLIIINCVFASKCKCYVDTAKERNRRKELRKSIRQRMKRRYAHGYPPTGRFTMASNSVWPCSFAGSKMDPGSATVLARKTVSRKTASWPLSGFSLVQPRSEMCVF